ncbi:hypothetical protein CBR_g40022 [Chara braunii]|uniref:Uncharacterized protein n=1 Tax=Chara braunii TaxID=69332 RepID=A0A388LSZ1_CHABU|nr:hypothetical protein CBR_g40022 [Chara braunii]|eukprot:GBG85379.1 hypothetical protein CBR_g40022 [Chara braunii]
MLISSQGLNLLLPVLMFHVLSFASGYWVPRMSLWRQDEKTARTLSICSGMQSSTLAMLLATQFLGFTHASPPSYSVHSTPHSQSIVSRVWRGVV